MKITSTHTTGELKPYVAQEGERISFKVVPKKGLRRNFWFTGKYNHVRNIYVHSMIFTQLGSVSKEDSENIKKMMLKGKTEILTDGRNYYTFYGEWSRIENMGAYIEYNQSILPRL